MKQKLTHIIYVLIYILLSSNCYAKKINLKVLSKDNIENSILQKLDFKKIHKDSVSINLEINKISNYLKNIGYFTNTIDSVKKTSIEHIAYFSLNDKIEKATLTVKNDSVNMLSGFYTDKHIINVTIEKLQSLLLEVSNTLENKGKPFSKVQLKNILIKDSVLFADLEIYPSEKRIINKIIIKGYENFPKSFVKNYFKLNN